MANTFLTPSIIGREALMILENNLVAANLVHRDHQSEFTGAKVGDTITVRGPATFVAKEFTSTVDVQNATESSVSLTLEKHFDVTVAVTSKDWTLELQDFSRQIVAPAMSAIAEGVDGYLLSKYLQVHQFSGAAGDPPDTVDDLAAVEKVLNDARVPMSGRFALVNPTAKADMMSIEAVHRADARGDDGSALRDASMGRIMGIDWYMAQGIKSHTTGTLGGTPNVNGAVAEGATTMNIEAGVGTGTIVEGDIFTVAGAPGQYRFTATAAATDGAITGATFYPPAPAGGFENDADITIIASHTANLAGHRNGLTLAVVPLEVPMGAARSEYVNYNGLGIRVVYDYSATNKTDTISFDVLCGAKVQDPRLLCRILG